MWLFTRQGFISVVRHSHLPGPTSSAARRQAVYQVVATRGAEPAKRLLGERHACALGSDRWGASTWVPPQRRWACWAHLRRDCQAMADRDDAGSEVGQGLLNYSGVLFECWHEVRGRGPGSRQRCPSAGAVASSQELTHPIRP
jgi:hypothetical protein